jgi:predicted GNAT superfamily acetyltransferase
MTSQLLVENLDVEVRQCSRIEEFDACVALQREAFGLPDIELTPRRHLIVTHNAGGWVLGAFAKGRLVGFVLHVPAFLNGVRAGYSHMMAVAQDMQNFGIGATLKWAQRSRALAEGVRFIKWTWDPMQARNAHFNLNRLGVIVRSYGENFYGTDYTSQSGYGINPLGIDSDRLIAEWHLDSLRVAGVKDCILPLENRFVAHEIIIPNNWSEMLKNNPALARQEQLRVRSEFRHAFNQGLECTGFKRDPEQPRYLFQEAR